MKKSYLFSLIILLTSLSSLSARSGEGDALPSVQVTTIENQPIDLKEAVGDTPTVLIFYRGGWCPYCTKHLADLNSVKDSLKDLGFQIIAVSTDQSSELAKTPNITELDYTLLSDAKMHASDALGISYAMSDKMVKKYIAYGINLEKASGETHHKLPHPAAYLIKDGTIRYAYINEDYQVRLSGEEILAKAKEL